MLQSLRKKLYRVHTRKKGDEQCRRLNAHLDEGGSILLVHQMGRAGSMTTVNTLRGAGLDMPVVHTHWLNRKNLARRTSELARKLPENRFPLNIKTSRIVAPFTQAEQLQARPWHVASIFREPVARNVSVFFLMIHEYFDNFLQRYERGDITVAQMQARFLEQFPHQEPLDWFDEEIHDVFGVDVYASPFDHDKGYSIVSRGQVEVLLMKVETLNHSFASAFEAFLGVRVANLENTHVTRTGRKSDAYSAFLKEVDLPPSYVEHMYASRYARHFYTPEERDRFRAKWTRSAHPQ